MYNKNIIKYYYNSNNIGNFLNRKKLLGNGLIGAVVCGDLLKLQIYFFNNIVYDFKIKIYGCGSAIASLSFVSFFIKYKNLYNIYFIKNILISKKLKLPIVKIHCSVLSEELINLCIKNYKNNYLFN